MQKSMALFLWKGPPFITLSRNVEKVSERNELILQLKGKEVLETRDLK